VKNKHSRVERGLKLIQIKASRTSEACEEIIKISKSCCARRDSVRMRKENKQIIKTMVLALAPSKLHVD
jgi:hypothetical protein